MDVLMIVDMQEASFSGAVRYDAEGVVERINRLSEYVRKNEGRVIFIQHDGSVEDGHAPLSAGWKILADLVKENSDIIVRKTICDAFYETDLKEILDALGPERLIITGCATDFCVDTTIRAAVSHDYRVVVAADCHTTADRPYLKAEQIIQHHNWLWQDLLVPRAKVEVLSMQCLLVSGAFG